MDVRVGGRYRLVFSHQASTMEFFGTYREVTPHSRLVWTNEEGDNGESLTTVTFDENAGKTLLVVHDLYPSKEALDAAVASGSTGGMPETLDQLDELLGGDEESDVKRRRGYRAGPACDGDRDGQIHPRSRVSVG